MCLNENIKQPWPFATRVEDLQSTPPKGTGPCADMQPWPVPFNPGQSWHPSKTLRIRGKNNRVTTCEKG